MINEERIPRDIVVVGASAGGVEALGNLFAVLPPALPAAVAVVIHRSPVAKTMLSWVLGRRTRLPVAEPADGEALEPSRIYVAPRDQHMVVDGPQLRLHRGPKEHRTRPAIDPLFRSAAAAYRSRVVGVLLSGFGDDGVTGLVAIKAAGGLVLVQDPQEARHPTMPLAAIAKDGVDAALDLADIGRALTALAESRAVAGSPPSAEASAPPAA
jgi:two-component system chemotaxis response regulator CheB